MRLSGNTVLVTGGSMGIGLALAESFLRAGSEVVVCGRRQDRLQEAKAKHPALHVWKCDVAKATEREALMTWMGATFPRFNVLVNNAGIQRDVDLTSVTDVTIGASEIAINLEAPIALTALAFPQLVGKEGAAVMNVSSGLAFTPMAKMPIYCATKAALHSYTMSLRVQLAKHGINVFELVPPAVDTELNPEGRAKRAGWKPDVTPEQFAAAVMKGLEADQLEIGFGTSASALTASKAELDQRFAMMNRQ